MSTEYPRLPDIVTSHQGYGAMRVEEVNRTGDGPGGRIVLTCRLFPHGRQQTVAFIAGPRPGVLFEAGKWGTRGVTPEEGEFELAMALLSRGVGYLTKGSVDLRTQKKWPDSNLRDGVGDLENLPVAGAGEIWKYIAAKIYWAWHFGFRSIRFWPADSMHLGLAYNESKHELGLNPGEMETVAAAGIGEYWERESGGYIAKRKLLDEFQARRMWLPPPAYEPG